MTLRYIVFCIGLFFIDFDSIVVSLPGTVDLKAVVLFVASPFLVIAELIVIFALRLGVLELLWLIVIPVLCLMLTCVFGISVNLKLPKMNWETEVSVVKQSAASMIGGIVASLVIILCAIPVLLVPTQYTDVVCLVICIILATLTVRLYYKNNRVDLKEI